MTFLDYTESIHRYWGRRYEGSRRLELERAAANPVTGWLSVDVPVLVDDGGVTPEDLRKHPDEFLDQARAGFRSFVDERELDSPTSSRGVYDRLPIHLTGASQVRELASGFDNPVESTNELAVLRSVTVTSDVSVEPSVQSLTYRCPAGHETTLTQPLFRQWMTRQCGENGCAAPVVTDDSKTRVGRVLEFDIELGGTTIECVGAGRMAEDSAVRNGLISASDIFVTGIPRFIVQSDGTHRQGMEVLHAEPVS